MRRRDTLIGILTCQICGYDSAQARVEPRPNENRPELRGKYLVCEVCRLAYFEDRPYKRLGR